jgi:hypothetical protein
MGHDDQGSFAAEEVDEQLEEGIDGEGLKTLRKKWCRQQNTHTS